MCSSSCVFFVLITGVHQVVPMQIGQLVEGAIARAANVLPFAGVDLLVLVEAALCREPVAARCTFEALVRFGRVPDHRVR